MRFLHGPALTAAIRETVAAAPVEMAVAFWGGNAVERLGLPQNLAGYRIACDARSGACSPGSLATMLDRGAKIVDVSGLHAKIYRSATRLVVTSANASTNGLTEDLGPDAGLEAGISTSDPNAISEAGNWFESVIRSGRGVSLDDLPEIRVLWRSRRRGRPLRATLAEALLANNGSLADRALRAYIYAATKPPLAVQERFKRSPLFDPASWDEETWPFFWGELPDIRAGDELLCFEVSGQEASYEGIWKVHEQLHDEGKKIWPLTEVAETPAGRIGDMTTIAAWVSVATQAGQLRIDGPPITLVELAAAIAQTFMARHLAKIRDAQTRAAYRRLLDASSSLGLLASPNRGNVPAVRLHDGRGRYVFSFIVNVADLLFYLREPALEASPGLVDRARQVGFTIEIPVARSSRSKPKAERQVRLRTPADVMRLVDWLRTEMPLPLPRAPRSTPTQLNPNPVRPE